VNLAWYAAYGSNTDEGRFRRYLTGCRAPVEPIDSRPLVIDLPLYFAERRSRTWGVGGVAFAGPDRDDEPSTLARAWLLPAPRIAEIGAQENGLPLDAAALDPDGGDQVAFPDRWYDVWRRCGALEGHPVFTLTSSSSRTPCTTPGRPYAATVAAGLRHTHGLSPAATAAYLATRTNLPVATLMAWQGAGNG